MTHSGKRHVDNSPPPRLRISGAIPSLPLSSMSSCTPSPLCLVEMDSDKFIICFPLLQVDSVVWLNGNGEIRAEKSVFSRR